MDKNNAYKKYIRPYSRTLKVTGLCSGFCKLACGMSELWNDPWPSVQPPGIIFSVTILNVDVHLKSGYWRAGWLPGPGLDIEHGAQPPGGLQSPQPRHWGRAGLQVRLAAYQQSRGPGWGHWMSYWKWCCCILPEKRLELAEDLMSNESSDEGLIMSKHSRMISNFVFAKLLLKKSAELISFGRKSLLFIFVWEIMLYSV